MNKQVTTKQAMDVDAGFMIPDAWLDGFGFHSYLCPPA